MLGDFRLSVQNVWDVFFPTWGSHNTSLSWQGELNGVPIKFPILLIQLLHGLCTIFPQFPCDLVVWHHLTVTHNPVTLWHLVMWYFFALHPCIVSSEKKRKVNNDFSCFAKLWHLLERTRYRIEVSPDLDKEGASVQFLSEKVLGPLCGLISLEEYQCP